MLMVFILNAPVISEPDQRHHGDRRIDGLCKAAGKHADKRRKHISPALQQKGIAQTEESGDKRIVAHRTGQENVDRKKADQHHQVLAPRRQAD